MLGQRIDVRRALRLKHEGHLTPASPPPGKPRPRLPEQVREEMAFAKDFDPDVRHSVAHALRLTRTPEAQRPLIDLSKDPNGRVQGLAFQVLSAQPSTTAMLVELEQVVKSGGVDPEAGPAVLTLLEAKRQ